MRRFFLVFILAAYSLLTTGQETNVKKKGCGCRFQSINQVGLMQGQYNASLLLQSVNGIRYKQWFAGAGVGIDYYRFRGVPLFADLRYYFLNKRNTPFVFGNGGIQLNWLTDKQKTVNWFNESSKYKNGTYSDVGLGYSFELKNNMALLLSAGYSYKNITEERSITFPCLVPPCPINIETYKYGLNRLSLKLGIQF